MKPIDFRRWIDEHRDLLRPPVGNAQIWEGDRDFMVTVVGGPNKRTDYHVNQGEEFFYQVEGDINLRLLQHKKPVDMPIREGEIFLSRRARRTLRSGPRTRWGWSSSGAACPTNRTPSSGSATGAATSSTASRSTSPTS